MAKRSLDFDMPLSKSHNNGKRPCDWPGCREAGEHRAPKSRDKLNEYFWFCMDHVREYNKAWNYYAGMSEAEIEADRRRDTTWQRKTWKFGSNTDHAKKEAFDDAFGIFDDDNDPRAGKQSKQQSRAYGAEAQALELFELEPGATMDEIKARFKELSKKHHPDTNGGDKDAEERFKEINEAYHILTAAQEA